MTHDRDSLRKELTKLTKTLSERDVALRRLGAPSASFDGAAPGGSAHGEEAVAHGRYGPLPLLHGADPAQFGEKG